MLEAATKLEEAVKTGVVDPADLTAVAALMREEAATGGNTKTTDKSAELGEAKPNPKDPEDAKNGGDDEMQEKAKKEAAAAAAGNLSEAERLQRDHPSIYQAALAEAQRVVGGTTDNDKELAQLRAEKLMRESSELGRRKLSESGLPEATFDRILVDLLGMSAAEMDARIAAESRYLEAAGVERKRAAGAGEKLQLREAAGSALTNELIAGVVKE
jgi:hypothetical protein